MGSVEWRLSGTASPEQAAAVERALVGIVTRAPASVEDQLAAWPFSFDTSVYRRAMANDAFVSLNNGDLGELVVITILPAPDPPVADRTEAARNVLAHPLIRTVVRDPSWESSGQQPNQPFSEMDGVTMRAWVTQTPTNNAARMVIRVGFAEDGRRLVAILVVAPSPSDLRFFEASRRFQRVTDSLTLR